MARLAENYAEGRLEHEEYDERLDAVCSARTHADLDVVFTDLPHLPAPVAVVAPARKSYARAGRFRLPLVHILAVLIVVSILTGNPWWLLMVPLMIIERRRRRQFPRRWAGRALTHG